MSNHVPKKAILLHHRQVEKARARRLEQAENRRRNFEINRAAIKAKVNSDRQYLLIGVFVFLIGLMLIVAESFYFTGAILFN